MVCQKLPAPSFKAREVPAERFYTSRVDPIPKLDGIQTKVSKIEVRVVQDHESVPILQVRQLNPT